MAIGSPPSETKQGASIRRHGRSFFWVLGIAVTFAAGAAAAFLAGSVHNAPSALTVLTRALKQTSAESYAFSVDSTVQFDGRQLHSTTVTGSFDPSRGLGTELLSTSNKNRPAKVQIHFIGRYVYSWVSPASGLGVSAAKPWNKAPVPSAPTQATGAYGFVSYQPVSPAELSGALLSAGTVRDSGSASGRGWAGTSYTFTVGVPGGAMTGTVDVDRHGQVRRLVTVARHARFAQDRDLTFSDFGVRETVHAPPVGQVEPTSRPDWGFYF